MTDAEEPAKELVPLAWSWIAPPKLTMEGLEYDYETFTYDQAQKAYVLECEDEEEEIEFELEVDEDSYDVGQELINPAIVVEGWGRDDVELEIDGKEIETGDDFRVGYEKDEDSTNLVLWLKIKSDKTMRFTLKRVD
jgi:hypothetical protein